MTDQHNVTLATYERPDTVRAYAGEAGLRYSESVLYDKLIPAGSDILDLGVGGGRTTPYLSGRAKRYVGIDYSDAMIAACRSKYPDRDFRVADAADLSAFDDKTFDVVVFSFNGLANLHPSAARLNCLAECARVLRDGGLFLFSMPNPRSLFIRPHRKGNTALGLAKGLAESLAENAARVARRLTGAAFWAGEGYEWSSAHGGMYRYIITPEKVIAELGRFGFSLVAMHNENIPKPDMRLVTRWYEYAFRKTG